MTNMKNTNNSKRNYRINFTTMTLTMTVDFAERAYNPATDEYKILLRLQHDFPDLKVERKPGMDFLTAQDNIG